MIFDLCNEVLIYKHIGKYQRRRSVPLLEDVFCIDYIVTNNKNYNYVCQTSLFNAWERNFSIPKLEDGGKSNEYKLLMLRDILTVQYLSFILKGILLAY